VAQPCLTQAQHTPRFLFQDATVLLIAAGRLDLDGSIDRIAVQACTSLLLVEANACADLIKTPGGMEQRFRSIFLTLSPELLAAFRRGRAMESETLQASASFRKIPWTPTSDPRYSMCLRVQEPGRSVTSAFDTGPWTFWRHWPSAASHSGHPCHRGCPGGCAP
jgi:hypothetical protein